MITISIKKSSSDYDYYYIITMIYICSKTPTLIKLTFKISINDTKIFLKECIAAKIFAFDKDP